MDCDHPLNCQIQCFEEVSDYLFPGRRHPHICKGSPLMAYKWSPNQCVKDMVNANQVFFFISCQGLCAQFMWLYLEFQFTATIIMSMATRSSDLEDRRSGSNLQTEGHAGMEPQCQQGPEETGVLGSSPSHLPSWSPARGLLPNCPNTRYCLGIHVTKTKETGVVPPPSLAWTVPLVEDMFRYARTGLTEAVVTGPGRAVLFYGRHSLGEGLSPDKSGDAAFVLTGVGTWVGKPAYLAADPLTIQESWQEIAQAIPECWIKARGPRHPCVNPLTPQTFRFDWQGDSPWKDIPRDANLEHILSPHQPSRSQNHNGCRRDWGLLPPEPPSLSPDHGFENSRSSVLITSLMSLLSDWSEGSQHPWRGRWCGEAGAHMKINLPIFKDKDTKDAVTYQSWRWDLMVYHCVGWWDCTLLPYTIWPLQGYHGELVQSSGTDITLDDVLMILDEHYNNVKALDALIQELFQLWMADKEIVSNRGICLSRHLQVLAASFPDCFPPNHVAELKQDCFYVRLPKRLKAMVAYLKGSLHEKTYSDYLRAVREAEKKESMELSHYSHSQVIDNTTKPKTTSFFPLQKLKGNQPVSKTATICLAHLEEESMEREEEDETKDPDGIDGVTEEIMVCLTWAVKDAQVEKCCYHCSSTKHFIHACLLVRASKENM